MFVTDQTRPTNGLKTSNAAIFVVQVPGLRYYSPRLGRWTSRDPIGEGGGENVLCFCFNNSFIYFDYLGNQGCSKICATEPEERSTEEDVMFSAVHGLKGIEEISIPTDGAISLDQLTRSECCVKELHVLGHGLVQKDATGNVLLRGQNLLGIKNRVKDKLAKAIVARRAAGGGPIHVEGLDLFAGINWCAHCVITLHGCEVGNGDLGRQLVDDLARYTGCRVEAWSTETQPPFAHNGFPAGRSWGIATKPDVIGIPPPPAPHP